MKLLGFEFAPLLIPIERRLQTISVFYFTSTFLFMGFSCLLLMIYLLLFTKYYWIPVIYFTYYFFDRKTSAQGGRRINFMRYSPVWKHYANFFPLKLIKTAELDPKKNYILGCHPHGIMCYSHFGNFATEGSGFSKIFPGITSYLTVLNGQFMFPIFRDIFMTSGAVEVSRESISYLLNQPEKGNAVALIIGGASEALDASPGNYTVRKTGRKGFCKLALKYGASLVPVYAFGENDLYVQLRNPDGSKLRQFQEFCTHKLGFSPPLFHGRGIFNYTFGLVPYRRPLNTVVGSPIDVEKNENPTAEDIDKLHKQYLQALEDLFETHKVNYGVDKDDHLIFKK
ncbi:hypothetical protein LOTGIDRAFT_206209 [Lottia gigantea]|uniref:Acyltransferase n=1 Tax=Lottia gigantea TaxID=225164 RepID=V4AYX7_LOTGI|nr:hypothetical protein LOTGIDRAFT_206209 [Lottia gigantea]ESO98921.1 hypothetical protein LOTGIDRAFT_206209 [Lottia gigantea]